MITKRKRRRTHLLEKFLFFKSHVTLANCTKRVRPNGDARVVALHSTHYDAIQNLSPSLFGEGTSDKGAYLPKHTNASRSVRKKKIAKEEK